jgi:site-specific recombinase XerD
MYEDPGNERRPVNSLGKMTKLHPDNKWLWQKAHDSYAGEDSVCFCNVPVSKNTLGNMMQNISKEANLSNIYTNHCIRATCISVLYESGYETRHIIGLSGHKSESSIKHYASRLNETKKA